MLFSDYSNFKFSYSGIEIPTFGEKFLLDSYYHSNVPTFFPQKMDTLILIRVFEKPATEILPSIILPGIIV